MYRKEAFPLVEPVQDEDERRYFVRTK